MFIFETGSKNSAQWCSADAWRGGNRTLGEAEDASEEIRIPEAIRSARESLSRFPDGAEVARAAACLA